MDKKIFHKEHPRKQKGLPNHLSKFVELLITQPNRRIDPHQYKQSKKDLNSCLNQFRIYDLTTILDDLLDSKESLIKAIKECHSVIKRILKSNYHPILVKAYINLMKKHRIEHKDRVDYKSLLDTVQYVSLDDVAYFIEAFDLQVGSERSRKLIQSMIEKGDYPSALRVVKNENSREALIKYIAQKCENQKTIQTINETIEELSKLGYKKSDFPKLHDKGIICQFYKIYQEEGPWYAQQVFVSFKNILLILYKLMVRDQKVKKDYILSFCLRNKEIIRALQNSKAIQQSLLNFQKYYIENELRIDEFRPSDSKKYLTLDAFKIQEKDVIFLDSKTQNIKKYLEDIVDSRFIGIDTESFVPRTKFSTVQELLQTIQIYNGRKAYIIDAKNIDKGLVGSILSKFFYDPDKIVIGHTLKEDLKAVLLGMGIVNDYICKTVDVKQNFKILYPGQRAGLQNISQVVLGKPICKKYTLTDWSRRPLLKNQLHYAALDSVVVVSIFTEQEKQISKRGKEKIGK